MKRTALSIAALVTAAASADAQPTTPSLNLTPAPGGGREFAVPADVRPTLFTPTDGTIRLAATADARPTIRLWSIGAIERAVTVAARSTVPAPILWPVDESTMPLAVSANVRRPVSLVNWSMTPAPAQLDVNPSGLGAAMFKRYFEVHLNRGNVDWAGLFHDQLRLDGIMHFKRMTEPKTVREVYGQKHFPGGRPGRR
jgi:hypothetical protein